MKISLLLIQSLFLFISFVYCSQNEYTFNDGEITVKVPGNGNVPFFNLITKDSSYFFKLMQVYELEMKGNNWNKVGGSNIALPSLSWTITTNTTNNSFVFTGLGTDQFKNITFVNKLYSGSQNGVCNKDGFDSCQRTCNRSCNSDNCLQGCNVLTQTTYKNISNCASGCENTNNGDCLTSCKQNYDCLNQECSSHLKMDIIINQYNWVSKDSNSKLSLDYDITGKSQNATVNSNSANFGNFWIYFNQSTYYLPNTCTTCSDSCVCNSTNLVNSKMVDASSGNKLSISFQFDHFPNGYTLFNDPILRVSKSSSSSIITLSLFLSAILIFLLI